MANFDVDGISVKVTVSQSGWSWNRSVCASPRPAFVNAAVQRVEPRVGSGAAGPVRRGGAVERIGAVDGAVFLLEDPAPRQRGLIHGAEYTAKVC